MPTLREYLTYFNCLQIGTRRFKLKRSCYGYNMQRSTNVATKLGIGIIPRFNEWPSSTGYKPLLLTLVRDARNRQHHQQSVTILYSFSRTGCSVTINIKVQGVFGNR